MSSEAVLPDRTVDPASASTTAAAEGSAQPPKPAADKAPKKPKAPKQPKPPKDPKAPQPPKTSKPKPEKKDDTPIDPDAMFKQGFLNDVYNERPAKRVVTRFPPEPNGYLHLGHCKAIAINFGFARHHGGDCYLRFDDTNPEAEEEVFTIMIREMIEWLGFKPFQVTYASDNFEKMYQLAEKLIELDGAYVCHCTDEDVNKQRGEGKGLERSHCKHRDRPIEESITEFRAMRDGKYKPREAWLRMKQDITDPNPKMWDLSAYRILEKSHHRTGNKWRIYPTYDFAHCLCDSIEDITHSLCTTEFLTARKSYEWLCEKVKVYVPMQREYGRLNVTNTVTSKRKIAKMVEGGIVRGWDDPRLNTLAAFRRRGVPPGAILAFVNELGVTTSTTNIEMARFDQSIRKYLDLTVPRLMLVLDPIPIILDNLPDDYVEEMELPFNPRDPSLGNHMVPFSKRIYIDRSDFREVDSKDYFRLAPGKSVGLHKVTYPITATSFKKDEATGLITEIHANYEKDGPIKKPKTYIQWVGESEKHGSPIKAEARIFHSLFKSLNPDAVEGGFMADLNPGSEEIFSNAIIEVGLEEVRKRAPWPNAEGEKAVGAAEAGYETVRFQALRVAYFAMDKDSKDGKVILNRIVSLKEDAGKTA